MISRSGCILSISRWIWSVLCAEIYPISATASPGYRTATSGNGDLAKHCSPDIPGNLWRNFRIVAAESVTDILMRVVYGFPLQYLIHLISRLQLVQESRVVGPYPSGGLSPSQSEIQWSTGSLPGPVPSPSVVVGNPGSVVGHLFENSWDVEELM